MVWHSLIIDEIYEFYDGVDAYDLPPGEYVFTESVDFGMHGINLCRDGGNYTITGQRDPNIEYQPSTSESFIEIESDFGGEVVIDGDTTGPFFDNNELGD